MIGAGVIEGVNSKVGERSGNYLEVVVAIDISQKRAGEKCAAFVNRETGHQGAIGAPNIKSAVFCDCHNLVGPIVIDICDRGAGDNFTGDTLRPAGGIGAVRLYNENITIISGP